jgi:hypothetical protein
MTAAERRIGDTGPMSSVERALVFVLVAAGTAAADPTTPPPTHPFASSAVTAPAASAPITKPIAVSPLLVFDVPALPPPSLRLEAARIAGMRGDLDWRYPEPGPLFGTNNGAWFIGYGHYRPRTGRSAALHGGSVAASIVGQILLETDTPLAGVGALLTGVTLDAAAADVDRDAETQRPLR